MSILSNMGRKYRVRKKHINSTFSANPETFLKNLEEKFKKAKAVRNLNRPKAITVAYELISDCERVVLKYRQDDNVDGIYDVNMLKTEIEVFLTNFPIEEVDRVLHKSGGDNYLDVARDNFDLAKKFKNIKRVDSIVYAFYAIAKYDEALVFFKQENISRKDVAEREKKEVESFCGFFTEDEILEAKKIILKKKKL